MRRSGADLTLEDRIAAAWLWSRRRGVVCGLAASALHRAKWVDTDVPIELALPNRRAPAGVIARNTVLSDDEVINRGTMKITTVERTAFDLARSGGVRQAVARLDALAAATHYKDADVQELARRHPRAREIRRLDGSSGLGRCRCGVSSGKPCAIAFDGQRLSRPQRRFRSRVRTGFRAHLDMGWQDIMVAVEYDGEHHRKDTPSYRRDIVRLEYIQSLGWIVVRVVAGNRPREVVERVRRARASRLR